MSVLLLFAFFAFTRGEMSNTALHQKYTRRDEESSRQCLLNMQVDCPERQLITSNIVIPFDVSEEQRQHELVRGKKSKQTKRIQEHGECRQQYQQRSPCYEHYDQCNSRNHHNYHRRIDYEDICRFKRHCPLKISCHEPNRTERCPYDGCHPYHYPTKTVHAHTGFEGFYEPCPHKEERNVIPTTHPYLYRESRGKIFAPYEPVHREYHEQGHRQPYYYPPGHENYNHHREPSRRPTSTDSYEFQPRYTSIIHHDQFTQPTQTRHAFPIEQDYGQSLSSYPPNYPNAPSFNQNEYKFSTLKNSFIPLPQAPPTIPSQILEKPHLKTRAAHEASIMKQATALEYRPKRIQDIIPDLLYSLTITPDLISQFPRRDEQMNYIKSTVTLIDQYRKAQKKRVPGDQLKKSVLKLIECLRSGVKCIELLNYSDLDIKEGSTTETPDTLSTSCAMAWKGDSVWSLDTIRDLMCNLEDIELRGKDSHTGTSINNIIHRRFDRKRRQIDSQHALVLDMDSKHFEDKGVHVEVDPVPLTNLYYEAARRLAGLNSPEPVQKPTDISPLGRYRTTRRDLKWILIGYLQNANYSEALSQLRKAKAVDEEVKV